MARAFDSARTSIKQQLQEIADMGAARQKLEAELDIQAHGPTFDSLARLGEELRFVLITSRATGSTASRRSTPDGWYSQRSRGIQASSSPPTHSHLWYRFSWSLSSRASKGVEP